ncbi:MAG: PKD domain-containing protein [Stellaceae bacterium]
MMGRTAAWAVIAGLLCAAAAPGDAQPALSLAANPASGPAPLSVTFTVSPAPSPDSAIDFGDGSAASQLRPAQACAGCAAVTHVYQTNGRYVARLSSGSDVVGSATIAVGQ